MGEVSFNFKDKVVLITGSAGVLGKAIAVLFAESGAKVVIVDRNEEGVKLVSDECKTISPFGYQPLEITADLSKESELRRVMETTIKRFNGLDVLVNNVGVYIQTKIVENNAIENFDTVLNVNLRSYYVMTHLATPYLSKSGGSIVNVSSCQSTRTGVNSGPYSISKSGIDMLTKNSAIELGPLNVRVNCVNPGHIWPPMDLAKMTSDGIKNIKEWVEDTYPLGRYGRADEVAKVIAFLASNGASFVTGAHIPIDSAFGWMLSGLQGSKFN